MTDKTELDTHKHDTAILDLAARLLDTARGLDAAVKACAVLEFDFQLLQSELMDFYRDAGRIARQFGYVCCAFGIGDRSPVSPGLCQLKTATTHRRGPP